MVVPGLLVPAAVAIVPPSVLVTRDLRFGSAGSGIALPPTASALPTTVVVLRPPPSGQRPFRISPKRL